MQSRQPSKMFFTLHWQQTGLELARVPGVAEHAELLVSNVWYLLFLAIRLCFTLEF
jgi:hypothetical protein